jgi:hypothetical protein
MSDIPAPTDEHENRKDQSLLERAVTTVTGTPTGEPGGPRGWEAPLEEQQLEPEDEPSRSAD